MSELLYQSRFDVPPAAVIGAPPAETVTVDKWWRNTEVPPEEFEEPIVYEVYNDPQSFIVPVPEIQYYITVIPPEEFEELIVYEGYNDPQMFIVPVPEIRFFTTELAEEFEELLQYEQFNVLETPAEVVSAPEISFFTTLLPEEDEELLIFAPYNMPDLFEFTPVVAPEYFGGPSAILSAEFEDEFYTADFIFNTALWISAPGDGDKNISYSQKFPPPYRGSLVNFGKYMGTYSARGTNKSIGKDIIFYVPFIIPYDLRVDQIGVIVTTPTAGEFNYAIYPFERGLVGNKILDAGPVSAGVPGYRLCHIGLYMTAGAYLLAVVASVTTTIKSCQGQEYSSLGVADPDSSAEIVGFTESAASMPTTPTLTNDLNTAVPRIVLRVG